MDYEVEGACGTIFQSFWVSVCFGRVLRSSLLTHIPPPHTMTHHRIGDGITICLLLLFVTFFLACSFASAASSSSPPSSTHATSSHPESHATKKPSTPTSHPESSIISQQIKQVEAANKKKNTKSAAKPAASSSSSSTYPSTNCSTSTYNFSTPYSYCGANYFTAATYPNPGSTYSLINVQLVTRHGDRTPVNILPVYDVAYDFCDTTATMGFYEQIADAKNKHTSKTKKQKLHPRAAPPAEGRRLEKQPYLAPVSLSNPYASQLWQGSCQTGQLTSRGVQQLKEFGGALRDIYISQLNFLPDTYERDVTSFYARSTDVWRTRQSAESMLSGLWPSDSVNDDVIPLHIYPAEIETLYSNPVACDALVGIQLAQVMTQEWKAHLLADPTLWQDFDQIMNTQGLTDFHSSFDGFFDNFRTRECHSLPLPCSLTNTSQCVSQSQADYIYQQSNWEYSYVFNESPQSTELAQLGISGFMSVVRDLIIAKVNDDDESKRASSIGTPDFAYFSAHDTSIAAILGALNITGMNWPPYASNLFFELWLNNTYNAAAPSQLYETSDSADFTSSTSSTSTSTSSDIPSYYVRVLYNGAVLPMYAAGCCEEMCPVEMFVAYLDAMIPENLVELCAGDGQRKKVCKH